VGLERGGVTPTGTAVMLRREGAGASSQSSVSFASPYYTNAASFTTTALSSDVMLAETAIPLTVSGATAANKVYDGSTTAEITGGSLSGILGSDNVTVTLSGAFSDAFVGSNKTVTVTGTLGGTQAGAYSLTQPASVNASITARPITVTASADTKTYDGLTTSSAQPSITSGSLALGDIATFAQVFATKDAGSGKTLTPSVTTITTIGDADRSQNYSVTLVPVTSGEISVKALSITAPTIAPKPYDGNATTGTITLGTLSGLVGSETLTVTATGTFADELVGPSKIANITYTLGNGNNGGLATNYSLAAGTGSGAITAQTLTVTGITAENKIYDGNTSATLNTATYSLSGVVLGETITLNSTSYTATFASKNIGTRAVTVSGLSLSGTTAANYTLTQPTGLTAHCSIFLEWSCVW